MSPPTAEWLLAALVAPCIGSFLATLILRLPAGRSAVLGRSQCPECRQRLGPLDLIPLISWILLRGRCRHCGGRISPIYPAIEGAALGIALWAAGAGSGLTLLLSCVFGWTLLALAVIDWRSYQLPDPLVAALFVVGGIASLVDDAPHLVDHLIGAVAGFGSFALIAVAYRRWRGREGLGWGDAKLMGALGLWVTWAGLPGLVLIATSSALLFVLLRRLAGATLARTDRLPFGPFLALAGWIVWLYGPIVINWP